MDAYMLYLLLQEWVLTLTDTALALLVVVSRFSMRREAYQLAARHGAGFGIVHALVTTETAMTRNAGRRYGWPCCQRSQQASKQASGR